MILIQKGEALLALSAVAASTQTSSPYALPAIATQLTWQTSFGTNPASITVNLQTSNDGVTFDTIDTSTVVTGESRTIDTSALFVQVNISAISGGAAVTVSLVAKQVSLLSLGLSGSAIPDSAVLFNNEGVVDGSSDFTFDSTTGLVSFAISSGLSFAGTVNPITMVGGDDGFGDSAILIDDSLDGYIFFGAVHQWVAGIAAGGAIQFNTGNETLLKDLIVLGTVSATGYNSSDSSAGISTSITTSGLVGKTITVKDGLITGFA